MFALDTNTLRLLGLASLGTLLGACDPGAATHDFGEGPKTIQIPEGPKAIPEPAPDPETPELEPEVYPNCGSETLSLAFAPPQIMLVLDKSHSMVSNTWDHDRDDSTSEVTRWYSLHGVVSELAEDYGERLELGAVLFPSVDVDASDYAGACVVDVEPAAALGSTPEDLVAALPPGLSLDIYGGTPASAGIQAAMAHLEAAGAEGAQAIILVTDGAANCSPDAPTSALFSRYDETLAYEVAAAAERGVPVYVVGIDIEDELLQSPVANPWERLTEVALVGGAAREGTTPFYDVFDEIEFSDAVGEIANQVSCSVEVGVPTDMLSIMVAGAEVPNVEVCDGGDGWRAADGGTIELCAASCELAAETGGIEAVQQCVPEP